jgi:archaetidylinositol phosphate synthase
MILDKKRDDIDPLLSRIAGKISRVNPDTLTYLALLFSICAGLAFYYSSPTFELSNFYLLYGALFVFLNGLFDALDGKVAKITSRDSLRGDFLDHALDRYADVFIIGGLALSTWCRSSIGLLAIVGTLLTSYMGTQAQAVGYKRVYSGLLGRADRLILLISTPILQHVLLLLSVNLPYNLSLLELMMLYFGVVGNITAIQRFYSILKWFKER